MNPIFKIWSKLRPLWQRREVKREIDEELRFHLEQRTAENIAAGLSPEDAEREARKRFGNLQSVREECRDSRGASFGDATLKDLRFAFRVLRKNPGFVGVAVVSLALGIGLNSAVFSIINTVFFQTIQGVDRPDRVVEGADRVAYPTYQLLRDEAHSVSGLAAATKTAVAFASRDGFFHRAVPAVSDNYFSLLGVRPFLGRFFVAHAGGTPVATPEAVLDYQFWQRHLAGDPAIIGQTLSLNGLPFTVVGIAPETFHGPGPERPPFWVPLGMLPRLEGRAADWTDATNRNVEMIGRLNSDVALAQAEAEAEVLLNRDATLPLAKRLVFGTGHEDWNRDPSAEKRAELLLVTVVPLIVTGMILWIACSNVANLLLARAISRRREIAIRLATGASRWQVMRLLLLESLLLALGGGALGLLVSSWTVKFVFATFPEFNSLAVSVDGHVLAYTAGISLLSTLTVGLVPALQATRTDVASGLRTTDASGVTGLHGSRLRTFFLITQIAGSMALLVVTATFVHSLVASRFGQPAALMNHLLVAQLPESPFAMPAIERQREFREQLGATPGIKSITLLESMQGDTAHLYLPGTEEQTNAPSVSVLRVDAAFFQTTGNELLHGRNLDRAETVGVENDAVVNAAAARKFWPGQDAVGQRFSLGSGTKLSIAGVVDDRSQQPQIYRPLPASVAPTTALILTTPDASQLVVRTRQVLQRMAAPQSFPVVNTYRDTQYKELTQITQVSALIGALALLLAATGLYGSMSFSSNQRTREMGIRLALGATRGRVIRTLLASGLKISAVGCAVGLLLVLVAFRLMTGLIFGKWTLDFTALAAVATAYTFITLIACWLPARRAARVDPMIALRHE